ncbi:MAG: carbohydrate kinase family protein [Syntrophobacteraceae bacterium]
MQIDVLCVGMATYDLVYQVDHHPKEDEKCFASRFLMCGGGPAANAAVTVARLGGTAAFAGCLGSDLFGQMHFQELVSQGVITSLIVGDAKSSPTLSAILVKPEGKRSVVTHKGAAPIVEPDRLDFSTLSPRTILLDGHQPALSFHLVQKALEQNTATILDAGSVSETTARLARMCTYLVASEKFARDFSAQKDPAKALAFLARIAPVAVITLGEAGLIYSDSRSGAGGVLGKMGAFPVKAIDTTGAGDIFHGAFAFRTALGDDLASALKYASAAAALSCEKLGARTSIPSAAQVSQVLNSWQRE